MIRVVLAIALCLAAFTAQAQKSSYRCTPSNNTILFGTFDPLPNTVLDSTGTFIVTCTDSGGNANKTTTVDYTVALSNAVLRQMAPSAGTGTDRLNYDIYTNTLRNNQWGDGTTGSVIAGSLTIPGKSTVTSTGINYYGRISAPQDVSAISPPFAAPTTYSQALTMTVSCSVGGTPVTC
jgi:Spore Coat Protein U domain.